MDEFNIGWTLKDRYNRDGLSGVLAWASLGLYKRTVRKTLPYAEYTRYNGLDVGIRKRYFDEVISRVFPSYMMGDISTYEDGLVKALSHHVSAGDKVVVVGGGVGVTVTYAALHVGEHGRVDCFEGDITGVNAVRVTAIRNDVSSRVHVHHAIVGENIGVYGGSVGANLIPPSEIPSCDVLELDCEGSEIGILSQMSIRPRCIAVETHGFMGAPTNKVRQLLEELGYTVQHLGPAEPHLSKLNVIGDVMVLVGVRGSA